MQERLTSATVTRLEPASVCVNNVNLKEVIERGEEARAKARQALEWFRYLRRENRAAHQRSTDTLEAWANLNADAQGSVSGFWTSS
jgi:hypothetical protein